MALLTTPGAFKCRVSSTLSNTSANFSARNMFDGSEETCWNSDQGSSQWILLSFATAITVQQLRIMFQGGFVGQEGTVSTSEDGEAYTECSSIHPEDDNSLQTFEVSASRVRFLRIDFGGSSDFYGRMTIYRLEVYGSTV